MKNKFMSAVLVVCILLIPFTLVHSGSKNINNSNQFYRWLDETGTPKYSVSGSFCANYDSYRTYGLIVYGGHDDVPDNEYRNGEYRFLGYTYLESAYTNQAFPDDANMGNIPENWDYVTVPGALESWDSLEQTVQKPYMLYTKLDGHGAVTLTAADIGIMRTRVQSPATWMNQGSIYTYKSNNYYATFTVEPMGAGVLTAKMEPESERMDITGNSSSKYVDLNLTASINKPVGEIEYIKVVFHLPEGDKTRFFHNTNSLDIIQRADFPIPENLPGSFRFNATVISRSIFGDNLQKEVNCSISLYKENAPPVSKTPSPIPSTVPTPRPTYPAPTVTPVPTDTPRPSPDPSPIPDEYSPVREVDLWGDWNYWPGSPHRFLALEKIHLKVSVLGYVRDITVRLSPDLEKMQYTNSEAHTYDYSEDFFGYYVNFPEDSVIYPDYNAWVFPSAQWDYIIPLCDETISWEGMRKKGSYQMTVTVRGRAGQKQVITIDDIDITGNVYELLHPQPVE